MFSERFQELHKVVDYLTHADSGFVAIEVNDRISQNKCISFLETELTSKKIISVDLENTPEGMRPDNFIKSSVEENSDVSVFCVLNMSSLGKGEREDEIELLRNFNMGREKLADLDKLLVFFFPSYFVDLILRYAGDFYDFAPLRVIIPNPERPFMERREYEPEFADEKYLLNRVSFLKSRLDGDLDDEERFKVLMDLGDCYGKLYRYEEAIEVFEGAVELAEGREQKESVAAALLKIVEIARLANNYSFVERVYRLGVCLESELDDKRLKAAFLTSFARANRQVGNLDQAQILFLDALDLLKDIGLDKEWVVVSGEIARIFRVQGRYNEALKIYEQQLANYGKEDVRDRVVTKGDIANILTVQGQFNKALEIHEERIEELNKIEAPRVRAMAYRDIAVIYMQVGRINEAINLLKKQINELEKIGDLRVCALIMLDMAVAERDMGNEEAVRPLLEKSRLLSRRTGDLYTYYSTGIILGELMVALGERANGFQILHESLTGYEEMGFEADAKMIKKKISEIKES